MDPFFAMAGHIEGYSALSLGIVKDGIHFAKANHLAMGTEECVAGLGV